MPNGGLHHCGNCQHFDRDSSLCLLRDITIEQPPWTTCANIELPNDLAQGPVYSIVCQVKDGAGSYGDIPWFQGNRADTTPDPARENYTIVKVADRDGVMHEFLDVDAYMDFWKRNTPVEER